jgi:ABC-2 type transport system ATP-binding protein
VEIAKALLPGPRVLLMDEPTTGLDPGARRELWDHLGRLRESESLTVIFTTHHMDEADRSDRAAILDSGRLLVVDSPAHLRESVHGDVVSISCDDPVRLAAEVERELGFPAKVVAGQVRFEAADGLAAAARVRSRFPDAVRSLTAGKPGLEDVFVNLTGHAFPGDAA